MRAGHVTSGIEHIPKLFVLDGGASIRIEPPTAHLCATRPLSSTFPTEVFTTIFAPPRARDSHPASFNPYALMSSSTTLPLTSVFYAKIPSISNLSRSWIQELPPPPLLVPPFALTPLTFFHVTPNHANNNSIEINLHLAK
ncbi:hypothetical protein HAX54_041294 [Datura stramonium]|uniref:Uncharacterized protein n=1 Tax=Datura stramonium TaxID=4076 RepID=A0ABS8SL67_DATST|nr:hypothetical protein [Datura stramonium]